MRLYCPFCKSITIHEVKKVFRKDFGYSRFVLCPSVKEAEIGMAGYYCNSKTINERPESKNLVKNKKAKNK